MTDLPENNNPKHPQTSSSNPENGKTRKPEKTESRKKKHNSSVSVRTGVYHIKNSNSIRLVRNHRYKKGMFEVFEFTEDRLSDETKKNLLRIGGCRDVSTEWYDLVKETEATRFEIFLRNPNHHKKCQWDGWTRFSSRYIPLKTCTKCGKDFRNLQEQKDVCSDCSDEILHVLSEELETFKTKVTQTKKLPKGSWKEMQHFRNKVDNLGKDKNISRSGLKRLKDKLHSIYRYLIDQRRSEQNQYSNLVAELTDNVEKIVNRSQKSSKSTSSIIEELKRIRNRLHKLSNDKQLGIRDFRKLMDKLHKASKHEEEKFEKQKKEQQEKLKKWNEEEKKLEEKITTIEVGMEFNRENWDKLLELKKQIQNKSKSEHIGNKGKKRLISLVNHLMDQENILREMASLETRQNKKIHKSSSHKSANDFRRTLRTMNIGLGYSQELWNELVAIQRDIIQQKNEEKMTDSDFKTVMEMVNEKLDTLKKLRSWSH